MVAPSELREVANPARVGVLIQCEASEDEKGLSGIY